MKNCNSSTAQFNVKIFSSDLDVIFTSWNRNCFRRADSNSSPSKSTFSLFKNSSGCHHVELSSPFTWLLVPRAIDMRALSGAYSSYFIVSWNWPPPLFAMLDRSNLVGSLLVVFRWLCQPHDWHSWEDCSSLCIINRRHVQLPPLWWRYWFSLTEGRLSGR